MFQTSGSKSSLSVMNKTPKRLLLFTPVFIIILFVLFFRPNNRHGIMQQDISKKLQVIGTKNIYFGHRSVGENIISGLKELISSNKVDNFNLNKVKDLNFNGNFYFADSHIGQNGNPVSKVDEFIKTVDKLSSNDLNIAIMKFCYADIISTTDIESVFDYYVNSIETLKEKHKDLRIIHFTVPLKSQKSLYKKIAGLIKGEKDNTLADNSARNKFNKLLISRYPLNEIFDLAQIESTYPDGKRNFENLNGNKIYFLVKDYTTDGGHLNGEGQKLVASGLINFLSGAILQPDSNYAASEQI